MTKAAADGTSMCGSAPAETLADDAQIKVSHGAFLATDVHLPQRIPAGGLPAVLLRTPYGRRGLVDRIPGLAAALTQAGFALVTQDVRGNFDSTGTRVPFVCEASDGLATVDWVTTQRWSNDVVIPYGDSYTGFTAWAAAQGGHRGVLAVVARVTTTCIADEWFHRDGAFRLQLALPWLDFAFGRRLFERDPPAWQPGHTVIESRALPADLQVGWLARQIGDPFWDSHGLRGPEISRTVRVPVLHWTAWWDLFSRGQLRDYRARVQAGRQRDWLIIDSSDHEFHDLHNRESDAEHVARLAQQIRDLHDALTSESAGLPRRRISIARAAQPAGNTWPAPPTLFLRDGEHARLGPEGGALDPAPDVLPEPVMWVDDPSNPVPSTERWIWGPLRDGLPDEGAAHVRPDVVTFTQAEQLTPLTLLGMASLTVQVRLTQRDSHVVATLCDVRPDGRACRIIDGVTIVHPAPGWQETRIDMGAVGYQIQPGHRLRISIAATSFPRYPAAVPVGRHWWTDPLPEPQELGISTGRRSFLEITPDPVLAGGTLDARPAASR